MEDQILKEIKVKRAHGLIEKAQANGRKYREQLVGQIKEVLGETNNQGLTEEHISVHFNKEIPENEIFKAKITGITQDGLIGEMI